MAMILLRALYHLCACAVFGAAHRSLRRSLRRSLHRTATHIIAAAAARSVGAVAIADTDFDSDKSFRSEQGSKIGEFFDGFYLSQWRYQNLHSTWHISFTMVL